MGDDEYQAAVAAFIRARGVTRCPTACALPTQGTVAAADRAALKTYAAARAQSRTTVDVANPAARVRRSTSRRSETPASTSPQATRTRPR